jgi:bifunctional oligoribonuclease and PAP phosphatase NrnA
MGEGPEMGAGVTRGMKDDRGTAGEGGAPDAVTRARRDALEAVLPTLRQATRVVLTTHVNADGDGAGSQAAVAAWLAAAGAQVRIVNPTPFPAMFRFLLDDPGMIADAATAAGARALRERDLLLVLDTAEARRIGRVAKALDRRPIVVIDHHVQTAERLAAHVVADPTACATGELVYDLLEVAGLSRPWPSQVVEGIYTAIVTDTGSFRFANTTPRAHAMAADLIRQGVDPEAMYRRIFATVPLRRVELLRHALEHLEVDADHAISWITIGRDVMERLGTTTEDLDGIVEHARSIEGTEVAILFRETADGATKVSLRSAGALDVNAVARQFGGGGHVKASGALVAEPVEVARERVLAATRAALRAGADALPPTGGQP